MRTPGLFVLVACLLVATHGLPADDKTSDNRVGLTRPSTETPPQTSECGLDSLLGQVFGTSGNSDCNTGGGSNNPPVNEGGQPPYNPTDYEGGQPPYNPSDNGGGQTPYNPSDNGGGQTPYNPSDNGGGQTPYNPSDNGGGQTPYNPSDNGGGQSNNGGDNFPPPNSQPGQGEQGECVCVQYYLCNDNNSINDDGVGLIDIRIKDEECSDYLQKCCGADHTRPVDDPVTPKPKPRPDPTASTCGNRNFEGIGFRITGNNDNEAQYGEFPWMVAVIRPDPTLSQQGKAVNVYQCGGSLIHPQVVLTGAHCVRGKDNLVVRAGEWDTQTKNELYPTQDRRVTEVIVHEQFNNGSLANDPALLILENPVDMSVENVGTICLPEPNENMDGRECVASGWGKDLFGKEGKYSVILKRVDLPVVPQGPCLQALRKTRLGPRFKLHESFICAGGQPGKDTCKGDGGGPLVCPSRNNNRVYVQAGIVAWGIDCATETPGVYVNVPYFVNWINDKMRARNIV